VTVRILLPTALQKRQSEINFKAADMWSFAIVLWELATRNVPFADLSPMEAGMKVHWRDPSNAIKNRKHTVICYQINRKLFSDNFRSHWKASGSPFFLGFPNT